MKKINFAVILAAIGTFAFSGAVFAQTKNPPQKGPNAPKPPKTSEYHPQPAPKKPEVKPAPAPKKPEVKPAPAPKKPEVKPAPAPKKPEVQPPQPPRKPEVQPPQPPKHPEAGPGPKPVPGERHEPIERAPWENKIKEEKHYVPGYKKCELEKPGRPEDYINWGYISSNNFYSLELFDNWDGPMPMQLTLKRGEFFKIRLQENRKKGLEWIARYDDSVVNVKIKHKDKKNGLFGGRIYYAEIEISGRQHADTIIEFIHCDKKRWDNFEPPRNVMRLFVHND